jgi:ferrochelatase
MASSNVSANSNKPVPHGKIGILLVNLGTPDAPRFWSVCQFLKEFLSDPRVIETPRIFWWPILHFIILVLRPRRIAKHYAAVWNKETGEGPLKAITRSQAEKSADRGKGLDLNGSTRRARGILHRRRCAITPDIAWNDLKGAGCTESGPPLYPPDTPPTAASMTKFSKH